MLLTPSQSINISFSCDTRSESARSKTRESCKSRKVRKISSKIFESEFSLGCRTKLKTQNNFSKISHILNFSKFLICQFAIFFLKFFIYIFIYIYIFLMGLYFTFESTIILETKFGCLINEISILVSMF